MMQPLQGSFVALVTPMQSDGSLDFEALETLIEWHIESGTNGLVAVGTTGESATLSVSEHIEVIKKTISFAKGRIPVIAGTGANSTQEAIDLTQAAASIGADYALIVTPYYNKPNQEGLLKHFTKIADAVDIPQILYNVPSRTASDLMPDTVIKLANHPNIIGIKEAVDDSKRLAELLLISQKMSHQKNFSVLSGDDPTFNSFMANGGNGVISVAANIIPQHIAKICSLNLSKQFNEAEKLDLNFKNLYELLFVESNPMPVKWMLHKMGKIDSGIRLPLVSFNSAYHEQSLEEMLKLKLI